MRLPKLPSPIAILMLITLAAAIATWLLPAGQYKTLSYDNGSFVINTSGQRTTLPFTQRTLDSLHILIRSEKFSNGDIRKPVSIPGTYHRLPRNGQGPVDVVEAPLNGLYDVVEIVVFILCIGGFMNVFNTSGALEQGLTALSYRMKGKEKWLIVILTFLFSFGGASFGMGEETLMFYPVVTPLFLAAGYDLLIPVAVIYGGSQLGCLASFSNPFATIIASQTAGVNWTDGLTGRLIVLAIGTTITILYILRYAKKIRADPSRSLVLRLDGPVDSPYPPLDIPSPPSDGPPPPLVSPGPSRSPDEAPPHTGSPRLDAKSRWLLLVFLCSFLLMITGVVFLGWWLLQMSAVFLGAAVLTAFLLRMQESEFIHKFIKGAESLLGVTFIIGVARGITIILNSGHISDTIIYYSATLVSHLPPSLFILLLLLLYIIFTFFISSTSGMAVVTMPIISALAIVAGVPGREIVNAYLYGMGIMNFITPTGLIMPSLALVNVSFKAWLRFIYPLLLILFVLCCIALLIGIRL